LREKAERNASYNNGKEQKVAHRETSKIKFVAMNSNTARLIAED
jgi:hypothetical protein